MKIPCLGWIGVRAAGAILFSVASSGVEAQQRVVLEHAITAEPSDTVFSRLVTVQITKAPLQQALTAIARAAKVQLLYQVENVKSGTPVSIDVTRQPLGEVFSRALAQSQLKAVSLGRGVVSIEPMTRSARAAHGIVTGTVTNDSSKGAVKGAVVSIERQKLVVRSRDDGTFTFPDVPAGEYRVVVRCIGYSVWTGSVNVTDGESARMTIRLTPTATRLNDIITTATGQQRRLEVGNIITTLNADSVRQTAPITSLTDLLEARVPGLLVSRTSGTPGAPSRIRLRGVNSISLNNDPIVIVDGIRVNASEQLSHAVGRAPDMNGIKRTELTGMPNTPSALDQIDPNTIETVEIANGPSASAMYGSDAANGVIIITTKRGHPGLSRWQMNASQGISYMPPGSYSAGTFIFGHLPVGDLGQVVRCSPLEQGCVVDSIRTYQALNDPRYNIFSTGASTTASATIDGGTQNLIYAITANGSNRTGMLRLPAIEQRRFSTLHGFAAPNWMTNPERYTVWGGSSNLTSQVLPALQATLVTRLAHGWQRQSSLSNILADLTGAYIGSGEEESSQLVTCLTSCGAFPTGYTLYDTNENLTFANTLSLSWQPWAWLPITSAVGLDVMTQHSQEFIPVGFAARSGAVQDTLGGFSEGRGSYMSKTANLRTRIPVPLGGDRSLTIGVGMDATNQSNATMDGNGVNRFRGVQAGGSFDLASQTSQISNTYGWYVAPRLSLSSRLFIEPGIRIDAGSTSGARSKFSGFPKTSVSWLVSDEPFFPFKGLFPLLRTRLSYGNAGRQSSPIDKLRLASTLLPWNPVALIDGRPRNDIAVVTGYGNTLLHPEYSRELEGGFDVDVFADHRLSVEVTAYRKTTLDAIVSVPTAPSIGLTSSRIMRNIGNVRNSGLEVALNAQLVQSAPVAWRAGVQFSNTVSQVLSLAPGMSMIPSIPGANGVGTRIVTGYPLFGLWTRPIVGYADLDGNGMITKGEVRVGDSVVFIGEPIPKYNMSFSSDLALFHGRVHVYGLVDYQNGMTQVNDGGKGLLSVSPMTGQTPLSSQAAVAALDRTGYGLVETVNTLRFQSLSVNYTVPSSLARRVRAGSMTVALQGSNLGLHSNYRGKDPAVNAYSSGDERRDSGETPLPRTWSLMISLGR